MMYNTVRAGNWIFTSAAVLLLAAPALGATPDEKSGEILQKLSTQMADAKTFAADITLISEMAMYGQKIEQEGKLEVAAEKPNKYAMIARSGSEIDEARVTDGEQLTYYLDLAEAYEQGPAPETMEALFERDNLASLAVYGLLLKGDYQRFLENFDSLTYDRQETESDTKLDVIDFRRLGSEGELYVTSGDTPKLRKVEVGFSDRPVKYTFDFTRWDTNAELKEGTFTFTPPADAEKVPSVQKRFHEKVMAEAGRQAPKAPLLGEEAPDFTLQTLDGKDVTLAQHEGKDVVILDFWASWCAPCRRGLPILEKVATEFADKNVVLYPVNLLEPKVQAERAAEMLKLTSTVLLDTKGEVGDKFGVGPIPHSVIIDKDGIVQAVHQGISASYESELRHELETLTSGQSLVSAAPKAAKGATE